MRNLSILLASDLVVLSVYTFNIHNVRGTVRAGEILRSCESGALFYVLRYGDSEIHPLDKQKRIYYINRECTKFTNTYLEGRDD